MRATLAGTAAVAVSLALTAMPAAAGPSPAPNPSPAVGGPLPPVNAKSRVIDLVQPATVMVRTDWTAWVYTDTGELFHDEWSDLCTGMIVDPTGSIITAGHCLDDGMGGAQLTAITDVVDSLIRRGDISERRRQRYIDAVAAGDIRWRIEGPAADSLPEPEVHVQLGGGRGVYQPDAKEIPGEGARIIDVLPFKKGDVGLLKIEENDLPIVQLAPAVDVQAGQEVMSIGYPFGQADGDEVALTYRSGEINQVDTTGIHGPGNRFYETSATLSSGMSGGPAVALNGQVLGLGSFTILSENNSNFIVPSEIIIEMLNKHGIKNQPGQIDTLYRSALENYYRGYYSDAIKNFEQVLAMMPEHQPAADKSRKAAELRQRFGDQAKPVPPRENSGLPVTTIAVAAAVILLLVAALLLLLARRRRRRSAATAMTQPLLVGLPARIERVHSTVGAPASGERPMADHSDDATADIPAWRTDAAETWADSSPGPADHVNPPSSPSPVPNSSPVWPSESVPATSETTQRPASWCPSCGTPQGPGAAFCFRCGSPLPAAYSGTEGA